jgi:hypothetical protein
MSAANPWPEDEVDRQLQDTGTIRAILLGKRHQVREQVERVGAMRVQISVRSRAVGGALGDVVTEKAALSSQVAAHPRRPGADRNVRARPGCRNQLSYVGRGLSRQVEGAGETLE